MVREDSVGTFSKPIDRAYEESGRWMCSEATVNPEFPLQVEYNSGAHYWVGRWFGEVGYAFLCIHCFDVRKYPLTFVESVRGKIPKEITIKEEDDEEDMDNITPTDSTDSS